MQMSFQNVLLGPRILRCPQESAYFSLRIKRRATRPAAATLSFAIYLKAPGKKGGLNGAAVARKVLEFLSFLRFTWAEMEPPKKVGGSAVGRPVRFYD